MPQPTEGLVTLEHLIFLHTVAIEEFGGSHGLRERGRLEAAVARPLSGFGGELVFTTPFSRAAALLEALIQGHPFIDGNKRVAVMAAGFWLEREGYELNCSNEELYETAIAVIAHQMDLETLARWLQDHSVLKG